MREDLGFWDQAEDRDGYGFDDTMMIRSFFLVSSCTADMKQKLHSDKGEGRAGMDGLA